MSSETTLLLPNQETRRNGDITATPGTKSQLLTPIALVVGCTCIMAVGFVVGRFWHTPSTIVNLPPRSYSPYKATQFISFSINTLGGLDEFGECEGRVVDADGVCYLGNKEDLDEDISHRFAIVEEILLTLKEDALKEYPEIDHSPEVLKIFMLPEFYLRGPYGAYGLEELANDEGSLIVIADKVRDLIADEAFEHYLFVFGTLIAATSPENPSAPWNHPTQEIDKGDILYYNLAPVYRGGPNQSKAYLVPKQYISNADFLVRNKGLPSPRPNHLTEYSDLDEEVAAFLTGDRHVEFVEDGILNIDEIRIGIEICLDHRLDVLWKHLQDSGEDLVDVHLITSAGMAIERGATPLRPGGVVYLTDGGANSAACLRTDHGTYHPDKVCQAGHNEGPMGLRHIPVGGDGYSSYIELATCLNPDDAPWKPMMEGYYSNHATQGCAYTLKIHGIDVFDENSFFPPSVEIYPTIALPE